MSEDRTITIDDVARLAGVSRATAGRVVGNYGSVSDKSRAVSYTHLTLPTIA